jgi:hydrogenase expression/formation protein HypC
MCLAVPAQIIKRTEGPLGVVEIEGVRKEVSLILVPEAKVGDFVIIHVGHALALLDQEEAEATLKVVEEFREIY